MLNRLGATYLLLLALSTSASADPTLATALAMCQSRLYDLPKWIQRVERDPVLASHADTLKKLLLNPDPAGLQTEVIKLLVDLRNGNELRPVLAKALAEAKKHPEFPKLPGDDAELVDKFYGLIDAEIIAKGFAKDGQKMAFRPWEQIAKDQEALLSASGTSTIGSNSFLGQFQKLTRGVFRQGTRARLLNKAEDGLAERIRMIKNAKKSIHLMSWALYGDSSGTLFAELLIKRFKEDKIDVRIIVDGQTAERVGYRESLQKMKEAGIPVVEWRGRDNPYFGQHRKVLIVDAETGHGEAVAGGRNIGDDYLHTGTKPDSPKWRDSDVLYAGTPVMDNELQFTRIWNDQMDLLAERQPEKAEFYRSQKMSESKARIRQNKYADGVSMAILDHTPNADGFDPIYLAIVKAIDSATESIDITNAYVILTPEIKSAILRARAKTPAVRVRIFTNSAKSVDEPIVSVPILLSLADLKDSGVELFVKQGDTLHAKTIILDNQMTFVMSYNLHPRSLRYEGETANVMMSREFAKKATEDYEIDLAAAQRVRTVEDLGIPKSKMSQIANTYFRDQL